MLSRDVFDTFSTHSRLDTLLGTRWRQLRPFLFYFIFIYFFADRRASVLNKQNSQLFNCIVPPITQYDLGRPLSLSLSLTHTHTHTHTHTRTHARTRARARAHTHTRERERERQRETERDRERDRENYGAFLRPEGRQSS